MSDSSVPQPSPSRMTPFVGHPIVVGFVPHQPEHVALTAAEFARTAGGATVFFAYVDPSRYTADEFPDGTVHHVDLDPDVVDDAWEDRQTQMEASLHATMDKTGVPWEFRYLAGRPDRALTHLARAVDASLIMVGTREPGSGARMREFLEGSVAVLLSHHQHRPVLMVPLSVVDWKARVW